MKVSPGTVAPGASTQMSPERIATNTVYSVLFAISFSHLLNDTIQALLPSIYPLLMETHQLSFRQIGLITFTFQLTASLLQPVVGLVADRRSMPYSLPMGMGLTLMGLFALAMAGDFTHILIGASLVGAGSAIFHPESSRVAYMAAGRRRGLAQSLFQVGGNAGSAIGPLLAAAIVVPAGQRSIALFSILALFGVFVLWKVGTWQKMNMHRMRPSSRAHGRAAAKPSPSSSSPAATVPVKTVALTHRRVVFSIVVLLALTFSKYVYLSSMTSYYTFYLIDHFGVSIQNAQYHLFIFLAAVAVGTVVGGPIGDKIGRKRVIWVSILGVTPFTLWLPHANLATAAVLTVFIGLILASAFPAIVVYAQELIPGKIGMVAGLFFGFAFGMAGIGSAVLGDVADRTSIEFVIHLCAWLPLIGLLTIFLPNLRHYRGADAS